MIEPISAEQMERDYVYANYKTGEFFRQQSPREMAESFAKAHKIPLHDFFGPTRVRSIAHQRQDCMHMLRKNTTMSFSEIGRVFRRDHTTVLHGIKAAQKRAAQ